MKSWLAKIAWLILATPIFFSYYALVEISPLLYILGYLLFGMAVFIWTDTLKKG